MGAAASGGRVSEHLESLEDRYGRFPVDQTTIAVDPRVYDTARARTGQGILDAVVRVWNDPGEVFHVPEGEELVLPRRCGITVRSLRSVVTDAMAADHGLDCTVDSLARVTIVGLRNRADPATDPVYRLFAVVDANYHGGEPVGGTWRPFEAHQPLLPV